MTIEIVSVTGISGVGKTHTIKPLAEADNNTQYTDLLSSEIPSLTNRTFLVIDHVGFENDQTIRLIEEARSKTIRGCF